MKNVYDVLRKKELDLETVRQQVDALRCVAPLLADGPAEAPRPEPVIMQNIAQSVTQNNRWPLKVAEAAAGRT
ncbi:MAG TPA: hypothetical protein VF753_10760 [Terriglobales bacterium]